VNSSTISKVEKARHYAAEPERVRFEHFQVTFQGSNGEHTVRLNGAEFTCDCHFHEAHHEACAHIMALQRMLAPMLSEEQHSAGAAFTFATV
jgi:hypothetical protein